MASGTAKFSYHSTASTNSVDVITLSNGTHAVEVYNRGSSSNLFVTTGTSTAPVALAADTYIIPAGTSDVLPTGRLDSKQPTVVNIISDVAAQAYTVVAR